MKLNAEAYKDKVRGCWLGKNIGGTLGAPFECKRGVWDIDYYTQDMSGGAWPNDDLDLQLVWLCAAERYGRSVNAEILGEYWLTYVVADWSEYGAGKNNLRKGLLPPLSGWYHNHNRDSCGCFIRSEIWACLHPGNPAEAVKYAYEDAIVDHSNEGVYAEIFCAAVQSAAFAENGRDTLIQIGLSYTPEDCGVRRAINTAVESHKNGLDWKAARKKVLQAEPGSFGMMHGYGDREPEPDVPIGPKGYDAPSNIGIMIVGWLYGEGDFGKSLCIAAGCGEDSDCTAGTLGAVLGIIAGADGLPEKWLKPVGDGIKTISIDRTKGAAIPGTVSDLTARVCRLTPEFLGRNCDAMAEGGPQIVMAEGAGLFDNPASGIKELLKKQPFGFRRANVLLDITLTYPDGINIREGEALRFTVDVTNRINRQQWLNFRWFLPEGWDAPGGREFAVNLDQDHGGYGSLAFNMSICPHGISKAEYTVVLEIASQGRPSKMYLPLTFFNNPQVLR